jgi:hypothetical protein
MKKPRQYRGFFLQNIKRTSAVGGVRKARPDFRKVEHPGNTGAFSSRISNEHPQQAVFVKLNLISES